MIIYKKNVLAKIQHNVKRGVQGERAKFIDARAKRIKIYLYENCTAPRVGATNVNQDHKTYQSPRAPGAAVARRAPRQLRVGTTRINERTKNIGMDGENKKLRCSQLHPGGLVLKSKTKL